MRTKNNTCKLIAEIGINHNGDISIAKELMKLVSLAGCDGVKFQKRTIDRVYTQEELERPRQSPYGTTNRQQKEGLEFNKKEYNEIDAYAKNQNLFWFASPWDCESVNFLAAYAPPYMKVASPLITNFELLEAIRACSIPVILSTGMSTRKEVREAVDYLSSCVEYILACTSTYPTKQVEMNLNFISTLKKEFPKYKIGFSNHSPGIVFISAAAVLGAKMIEFHVTLDRTMYGSDQPSSIEPFGVQRIVKNVTGIQQAMGDGEWTIFPSEIEIRNKLRSRRCG